LLIIPAIEINDTRCVRTIIDDANRDVRVYSDDPVEMALLWRRENAKTLHILDRNGLYDGTLINREAILSVVETIEIPVQLIGRFADAAECEAWLDGGVYRLFLHDLVHYDPEGVRRLVARYGPSRVCIALITHEGKVVSTWRAMEPVDCVEFAARARELGIRRLFFTDRSYEGILRGPNFDQLERITDTSAMQVTAAGGVATVEHLWMLQQMECRGIDSVVIGRAFYENCFPCQQLWRDIEADKKRLGREWTEGVSTSALARGGDHRRPGPA
jgi:phosphoribosylformimino-5-aminoimidazole carboxamide ribotide isomerase